MKAWGMLLLLLLPALSGCLGPGSGMVVVASAPRVANGMSIVVALPRSVLGAAEGTAYYTISHQGSVVYPPGGGAVAAQFPVKEGQGSVFVPYNAFVINNGDYLVHVEFAGKRVAARAQVDKWVNWVYVFPYLRDQNLVAEVVLISTSGDPNTRMFAEGQLTVEVRYRGEDGRMNQFRLGRTLITDASETFQRLEIPLRSFKSTDRGYYSVEATFHNFQAHGNNNVALDPSLNDYSPPTNWVFLEGSRGPV